ncbi:MAG TPA: ABC transporter permease [Opitutaceae bacterium]|nr:ABC transporter permease [Opitutaceae bacterium]
MKSSPANPLAPFVDLYRHRTLLEQFTRRTIEQRHRGSFLGLLWAVIAPLLQLGIYSLVFGYFFKGKFGQIPNETGVDYALAVFLGLILFQFLSEVMALTPTTIVTQPNFVKKVVFPLEVLPAAVVGAAGFNALISLVLALIGTALLGHGVHLAAFWLVLILPPVALIALGCAWFLAALGVFIRDIANAMPFVVQALLYMSAVFFPVSWIPATKWGTLLRLNPMLQAVESARRAVVWHLPVAGKSIAYLWVAGLLICLFGYVSFRKLKPAFADVI